ncbi:MAG: DHH family phosphoesterase [Candidatus Diapherotrites archaeon]|nr:DHH family phosphoesterase [Candidatus Diapherotrites archaeon]
MGIPDSIQAAIRRFRNSLDDELYHVEHDTDMDGFASGIITTVALRRMDYEAYPYPVERSKTFVPERGAVVFTDIALHGEPTGTVRSAAEQGVNVYAIDHHPWEEKIEADLRGYLNPHLLPDIKNPSQWNTGFLAFLAFRDVAADYDWLAAISIYTDRCETRWSRYLIERYGRERVQRAGDMLTAYIATIQDLRDLDWILLDEMNGIDDVLNYKPFIVAERKFENAVQKYLNDPERYALLWDQEQKLAVLETEETYHGINSVVSTRLSFIPKFRDWIIIVLGREEDGTVKGSLRCQEWQKRGVHLGELASQIASQLGGQGGGHPVAAGMRIPPGKTEGEILRTLKDAVARA